jgi:NAD(P)H-flavin reductase
MIERPRPQKFTLRLGHIEKISSKVYLKRFDVVEPAELAFIPGQTVMLHVSPGVNRSMSIASAPGDNHSFWVAHDVTPMGPYSQWTLQAKVGDTMTCMAPLGIFILNTESHKKKIFVATGTGVTPFRSMVHHYLPAGMTDDITLYWGLRKQEDMFWDAELADLSHQYPSFRYVLTLSQPEPGWQGKVGRVTDHVFTDESNIRGAEFYLCGNKAMVAEMEEKLAVAGVPKEQVYKELFY